MFVSCLLSLRRLFIRSSYFTRTLLALLIIFSQRSALAAPGFDQKLDLSRFFGTLFVALSCVFFLGFLRSCYRAYLSKKVLHSELLSPSASLDEIRLLCDRHGRDLVNFAIFIPARGESRVIANTLLHLSRMRYDFRFLSIYVITDSRELQGDDDLVTADVASHAAARLNKQFGFEFIHVLSIPDSYDGQKVAGQPPSLSSSKGRALNYALDALNLTGTQVELIGILDADGRLHRDVLIEAAKRFVIDGASVLQGPVLQISNLDRVDLFGVMAGVELSIHHLSSLASQLQSRRRYPRFLAGTNYFICPRLLQSVGGWNSHSLVEDAELGLRLFFQSGKWAAWLPCPEIEQTSPSLQIYLKQRHRWALGHLQLLPQINQASLTWIEKLRLFWMVGRSILVAPFTAFLPVLGWALAIFYVVPHGASWSMALSLLLALLSLYTWDDFGRGLRLLNLHSPRPLTTLQVLRQSVSFMLLMPCLMIVQLIPRLRALLTFLMSGRARNNQVAWYKTERSVEDLAI